MNDSTLSGAVLHDDGSPAAGVRVACGSTTTTTDASGRFAFDPTQVGDARLIVLSRPAGFTAKPWWHRVSIGAAPVEFRLRADRQELPFTLAQLSDVP